MTFGTDADISNLSQFGWYEWVYFREDSASFPFQKEQLGRCLGPAKNENNEMAQWVLKENGSSSSGTSPSDGVSGYITLRWIGVDAGTIQSRYLF